MFISAILQCGYAIRVPCFSCDLVVTKSFSGCGFERCDHEQCAALGRPPNLTKPHRGQEGEVRLCIAEPGECGVRFNKARIWGDEKASGNDLITLLYNCGPEKFTGVLWNHLCPCLLGHDYHPERMSFNLGQGPPQGEEHSFCISLQWV